MAPFSGFLIADAQRARWSGVGLGGVVWPRRRVFHCAKANRADDHWIPLDFPNPVPTTNSASRVPLVAPSCVVTP